MRIWSDTIFVDSPGCFNDLPVLFASLAANVRYGSIKCNLFSIDLVPVVEPLEEWKKHPGTESYILLIRITFFLFILILHVYIGIVAGQTTYPR